MNIIKHLFIFVLIIFFIQIITPALYAETSLYGKVTDLETGYGIPTVAITCSNDEQTQTNPFGEYYFDDLGYGLYSFTFSKPGYATQTFNNVIVGDNQELNVQMSPPCTALNIVTDELPPASVGKPYNPVIEITCKTEPLQFQLISGELPPGLSLDSEYGNITGTPTQDASYSFSIGVTDAIGNYAEKGFMIVVTRELAFITPEKLPVATRGQNFFFNIEAENGTIPYQFENISGSLPKGLFLSKNGQIGGGGDILEFFDNSLPENWEYGGDTIPTISNEQRLQFANLGQNQTSFVKLNCHTTGNASISFDFGVLNQSNTSDILSFAVDQIEQGQFSNNQTDSFLLEGLAEGIHDFQWTFIKQSSASFYSAAWIDNVSIQGMNSIPTEIGTSYFTIRVTDNEGRTVKKNFRITVMDPLRFDTSPLPNGIVGHPYEQQLYATGGQEPYQWHLYFGRPPAGIQLESDTGRLIGTPQETAYGTLVFAVVDAHGRMTYMDSIFKVVEPLEMVSKKMPEGRIGESYSESIMMSGGIHPLSFTCADPLPSGLMLNDKTGVIYGTPDRIGFYNFNVTVIDQKLPSPQFVHQTLSMRISNKLIIISSAVLPKVQKNNEMTPLILKAAGGKSPLFWEITAGALPGGIQLDQNRGIISGNPKDKGNAIFTIKVTDNDDMTAEKEFFWLITDSLSFGTRILTDAIKNEAYEQIINGRGGYPPYFWRITSGSLLSGLEFNNRTGTIYGVPLKENEIRSFTVEISDSDTPAQTASRTFTMMTTSKSLYIITSDLPLARKNQMYNQLIRADLGSPPYSWRRKSGDLPDGISLIDDPETARLEGKPTETGEFYFEIEVSDSSFPKNVATQEYLLEVQGSVAIITEDLKQTCANQEYSDRIQVTNGTLPYNFEVVEGQGNLPGLLQLNPRSGEIKGHSNLQPGEHANFTVRVTDTGIPPVSDERSFFIYAMNCSLDISPKSLPKVSVMSGCEIKLSASGGMAPYRFSLDSGVLPSGLQLDPQIGKISGNPEHEGQYRFVIEVLDAAGSMARQTYTIEVLPCETCPIISGTIKYDTGGGLPEAKIVFRDANGYTKTTAIDENGHYEMRVAPGWSGTVIPTFIGHSFAPENFVYQQLMTDKTQQDFEASVLLFTITGEINGSENNQGVSNIRLRYGVAGFAVTTNEQGMFSIVVPFGWSGTISPENVGYEFSPQSMTIENIYQNLESKDFSASSTHQPQIQVTPLSLVFTKSNVRTATTQAISTPQCITGFGTGLIVPEDVIAYWKTHKPNDKYRKRSNLPEKKDWSQFDSPVKNQGGCGSCWAFTAIAYLENLANQAGLTQNIDLSEQSMVSCVYKNSQRYGCEGGWYADAFNYVKKQNIPSETCFPYETQNGQCDNRCETPEYEITLKDFTKHGSLWGSDSYNVQDIKGALQDGPLCVAMYVPSDFSRYKGGIIDFQGEKKSWGHAVLLVGYDDTLQCFKVKNSWGTNWGEDGYFRIAYNDTQDLKFGSFAGRASGIMMDNQGQVITITNTGTGNLEIQRIFSNNDSWLGYDSSDLSAIEPNSQKQISIFIKDWSQVSGIDQTAILTINSNDPIKNVSKINIRAMLQTQAMRPELSVVPPFQDNIIAEGDMFIIISNYNETQQTFSLSNLGDGDMEWELQSNSKWLEIVSNASGVNSSVVELEYPVNIGLKERTGNIVVTAFGAINSPQTVQLKQSCLPFPDLNNDNLLSISDVVQMLKVLSGMPINTDYYSPVSIKDTIFSLYRLSKKDE
ncbi:Ig domain-containing protein [Candidatus Magnetomorum sp. HK-1]|nr:Ig domain-containing protein [Candidatus Magnetomorum sp. HK-1]